MENRTILLVEDGEPIIRIWMELFKEIPYIVPVFVKTITDAREALKKIQFDAIFLDGTLDAKEKFSPEPETLPLFLEIWKQYTGKIFSITDNNGYIEIMKGYGINHVLKEDVPDFAAVLFKETPLSLVPRTSFYEIKPGALLVVQLMKNEILTHHKTYIAEIVSTGPLLLKIYEGITPFKPGSYRILETASRLIQGTLVEQNALCRDYARSEQGPLQSGISLFGGKLGDVLSFPNLTEAV
ncbi:MAG: response regulator [bacterium]